MARRRFGAGCLREHRDLLAAAEARRPRPELFGAGSAPESKTLGVLEALPARASSKSFLVLISA